MEKSAKKKQVEETQSLSENKNEITRRFFSKQLAGLGIFSGLVAASAAKTASAWLDGGFQKPTPHQENLALSAQTGHFPI